MFFTPIHEAEQQNICSGVQNVVLRVSRRKNSKLFPCGIFFLGFLQNFYWRVLVPWNLACPEKFLVGHLQLGCIIFAKGSILFVWQCSEYVCLNNCSATFTVTLWYVLHQTHSEFWYIQNSVYSGICRHIQAHSVLSRQLHT